MPLVLGLGLWRTPTGVCAARGRAPWTMCTPAFASDYAASLGPPAAHPTSLPRLQPRGDCYAALSAAPGAAREAIASKPSAAS